MKQLFGIGVFWAAMVALLAACAGLESEGPVSNDPPWAPVEIVRPEIPDAFKTMGERSTMDFVLDMGMGWNLGNTLEACGDWINGNTVTHFETAWGSPVITKAMIQGIADSGFGVVRIPVAWSNLMARDYTINPALLDRVEQIILWVLESDMDAIVNIHWDGGWFKNFSTDFDGTMAKYTAVWDQLCAYYEPYGERLMFEGLNEELHWDEIWTEWMADQSGKPRALGIANRINQAFVDLVRGSGGNNQQRHLLIPSYSTSISLACDPLFVMPTDPAGRMAISVHYYTPSTFAILEKDADWGKARTTWGTDADWAELRSEMGKMKTHYIDEGIPVIVGEFGSSTKNKTSEMVRYYLSSVAQEAWVRGLCPVLWDVTDVFYLRRKQTFKDPLLLEALMAVKELPRDL